MTIETQATSIEFSGDGSTVRFPVSFPFLADADLRVDLISADGTKIRWAITSDYSITTISGTQGGTVVAVVAPPENTRLVIERRTAKTQPTDLTPGAVLPSETLEQSFDRLTLVAQELGADVQSSLRKSSSEQGGAELILPEKRGGKALSFGAQGEPLAVLDAVLIGRVIGTRRRCHRGIGLPVPSGSRIAGWCWLPTQVRWAGVPIGCR